MMVGDEAAVQTLFAGGGQASDLLSIPKRSKLAQGLTVAAALVDCGLESSLSAVVRLAKGRGSRLEGETLQSGDVVLAPLIHGRHVGLGKEAPHSFRSEGLIAKTVPFAGRRQARRSVATGWSVLAGA